MNENRNLDFNFVDIVNLVWKYKKPLIIIGLAAAILTAIFTSPAFIKPKYKSEVVFYPTTINSIGNALLTDLNKREADLLAFGEEEEAENALQLLNSSAVQSRIVKNFNLMEHYEIDPDSKSPNTDLADKMAKNIEVKRTRHLAVKISVLDHDPEKAAEIANGIGALYDSVKSEVQQQVAREALTIMESEFKSKEKEVWDIRTNLKELASKGVTNYEEQSRAISEEIYKAGNSARGNSLRKQQEELAKYAGEFTYLNETLILELESLSQLRKRYQKAKVDVDKTLPQKFILTSATPAEKKTYPVRSMMVMMVTAATGFLCIVLLIIMNQMGWLKQ